jgi:hypothetical protein
MKKDRFFIDNVVMGLLLLLAITVGIYFRVTVKDCGLVKVNHVDDIKPGMVTLEYAIDKDEYFGADGISNAINELEQAPVIAIAKATGNLNLTRGTYGQEIIIEKVIRGENEISQGDTAWIYQSFGLEEMDGKILFRNCLNIMKPATEYLVFLQVSPLNPYQKENVYTLMHHALGYVRLDGVETKPLPMFGIKDFVELIDYEFFAVSEKVTTELNEARKTILEKYAIMQER